MVSRFISQVQVGGLPLLRGSRAPGDHDCSTATAARPAAAEPCVAAWVCTRAPCCPLLPLLRRLPPSTAPRATACPGRRSCRCAPCWRRARRRWAQTRSRHSACWRPASGASRRPPSPWRSERSRWPAASCWPRSGGRSLLPAAPALGPQRLPEPTWRGSSLAAAPARHSPRRQYQSTRSAALLSNVQSRMTALSTLALQLGSSAAPEDRELSMQVAGQVQLWVQVGRPALAGWVARPVRCGATL